MGIGRVSFEPILTCAGYLISAKASWLLDGEDIEAEVDLGKGTWNLGYDHGMENALKGHESLHQTQSALKF